MNSHVTQPIVFNLVNFHFNLFLLFFIFFWKEILQKKTFPFNACQMKNSSNWKFGFFLFLAFFSLPLRTFFFFVFVLTILFLQYVLLSTVSLFNYPSVQLKKKKVKNENSFKLSKFGSHLIPAPTPPPLVTQSFCAFRLILSFNFKIGSCACQFYFMYFWREEKQKREKLYQLNQLNAF